MTDESITAKEARHVRQSVDKHVSDRRGHTGPSSWGSFPTARSSDPSHLSCGHRQGEASHGRSLDIVQFSNIDLEKGTTETDHVVLSIQGLHCVPCEHKLSKCLASIPGIFNIQTSLVLSQAEFDLDLCVASTDDVVRLIKRRTGFVCQKLTSDGHNIDVIVEDSAKFVKQPHPPGVNYMIPIDKRRVQVTYNASIEGARNLCEKFFQPPLQLAPPRPHPTIAAGKDTVTKSTYLTLLSATLTLPVLILAWAPLPQYPLAYGIVSLVLATIVQVVVAGPFYRSAFMSLFYSRSIEMDLLIVLSTTTAYVFSVISFAFQALGQPLATGEFFETSTLLVTLIMLGHLVSALARQKAIESISIRSLQAATAILVDSNGNNERIIDARLLQYGDFFKVMPDSRVVTDGNVVLGTSEHDESMVTGEAQFVEKIPGSSVIAGAVNGAGTLVVQLVRLPGDNTISHIAGMVDETKYSKSRTQDLADRIAGYFIPIVAFLTLLTFVIWVVVGTIYRKESLAPAVVKAATYAISVLVVSCPCAIGLAVPMVTVIAAAVAAKRGVVFKSADTIEMARKVTHVVFDKTGTLTRGQLSISAEVYLIESQYTAGSLALGLTAGIKHPVANAIATHLQSTGVKPAMFKDVRSVAGSGIEGTWNEMPFRAGNSRWLGVDKLPLVRSLSQRGLTVFCVSGGDVLLAVYGLKNSLRPDAGLVISELKARGIGVSIISGDDSGAVQSIATDLGIDEKHVRSRCSPRQKQEYIKELINIKDKNVVMFCGDGTNDAIALAQADIGVHMNEGTDIAQSAADVFLLRPSLSGIITLMDVSQAAFKRIRLNFIWSFMYNLFAILLATGCFVKARISPQYAGLGEIVSVVPVILVAWQLKCAKIS
ncbi:MAG: hypothetical protein MMC33_002310 [Icmadophila ericetorum]|nr:hypothetical protein [Icmadophila ericetorum]